MTLHTLSHDLYEEMLADAASKVGVENVRQVKGRVVGSARR
jgi:hypothetical protein